MFKNCNIVYSLGATDEEKQSAITKIIMLPLFLWFLVWINSVSWDEVTDVDF